MTNTMNEPVFHIDQTIGFLIAKTHVLLKRNLQTTFRNGGYKITPEQWNMLVRLYEKDGITQKALGSVLFKDNANVTRMLDILEKKNMIERKSDPSDRRTFNIFITDEGRKITRELIRIVRQKRQHTAQEISEENLDQLKQRLLEIIKIAE